MLYQCVNKALYNYQHTKCSTYLLFLMYFGTLDACILKIFIVIFTFKAYIYIKRWLNVQRIEILCLVPGIYVKSHANAQYYMEVSCLFNLSICIVHAVQ